MPSGANYGAGPPADTWEEIVQKLTVVACAVHGYIGQESLRTGLYPECPVCKVDALRNAVRGLNSLYHLNDQPHPFVAGEMDKLLCLLCGDPWDRQAHQSFTTLLAKYHYVPEILKP